MENEFDGKGIYVWKDKKRYEGYFRHGKMHGYGTFISPNGIKYEGNFANDQKEGYGVITYT